MTTDPTDGCVYHNVTAYYQPVTLFVYTVSSFPVMSGGKPTHVHYLNMNVRDQ